MTACGCDVEYKKYSDQFSSDCLNFDVVTASHVLCRVVDVFHLSTVELFL